MDTSSSDYSGSGNTFAQDYSNNIPPTVFDFAEIVVSNNYVNNSFVPAQLGVSGSPYYVAISVDDTNYANDAVWSTYTSTNVSIPLGATEGWHDVWIGLRGHGDAPSAGVWWYKRLKLDFTPPLLVVTNPIVVAGAATTSVPLVQVQGYSPEELSSLSYDLSNAVVFVTNQDAGISGQYYDTNTWEFTTNWFECVDVPLTNGLNVITLHATDMAGNTTTTSLSVTLDYSSRTNPPAVNLYWPQDGTLICVSGYSWRGWVDDPTATVTAQMVDTNGDTNIFNGLVERDGKFWVENLPMSGGTNWLTLTVTDSAGNVAVTNITVMPGNVALSIVTPSSDQLWEQGITVTGTISDSTDYTLWVNGVQASLDGLGNWTATNVYLPTGGTAVIQARAIPNTDNGGNGTGGSGGGPVTYDNLGNPDPPQDNDAELETDKPPRLYVETYTLNQMGENIDDCVYYPEDPWGYGWSWSTDDTTDTVTKNWSDGSGGSGVEHVHQVYANNFTVTPVSSDAYWQYYWPTSYWPAVAYGIVIDPYGDTNSDDLLVNLEECDFDGPPLGGDYSGSYLWPTFPPYYETLTMKGYRHAHAVMKLQTGGKGTSQLQNLFCLSAAATRNVQIKDPLPIYGLTAPEYPIRPQNIQILGQALDTNGNLYVVLPDNATRIVTPIVNGVDDYTFNEPTPTKYPCSFTAYVRMPDPSGTAIYTGSFASRDYGHAWWCLSCAAPVSIIARFTSATNRLNVQEGWGPLGEIEHTVIGWDAYATGQVYPSSGDNTNRTYQIGFDQLIDGLNFAQNLYVNGSLIGWDGKKRNCAQELEQLGDTVGVPLPPVQYPEQLGHQLPPNN